MDGVRFVFGGEPPMTVEEFERLNEQNVYRTELVRGRRVREPPAGFAHSRLGVQLAARLLAFVEARRLGEVVGPDAGFVLSSDSATVRAPDVAFVARERIPGGESPDGFFRGAPDLAIEIVGPALTHLDMREKVADYLDAGTRLVWVVEPRSRTVAVHRPARAARILDPDGTLDGEDVLPGLRLPVAEIFRR